MPTTNEIKEFYSAKSYQPEYTCITFEHPDVDTFYLVANQYENITLGGIERTACPMSVVEPEQSSTPTSEITISFPRIVVGTQFKAAILAITQAGTMEPITMTLEHFIGPDLVNPDRIFTLYVSDDGGIVFSNDSVQVKCSDVNPMRRRVRRTYEPKDFTGLKQ